MGCSARRRSLAGLLVPLTFLLCSPPSTADAARTATQTVSALQPMAAGPGLICFLQTEGDEGVAIWTVSPDGSNLREVVRGDGTQLLGDPALSQNASRLIYTVSFPGTYANRLWVCNVDGSQPRDVTPTNPRLAGCRYGDPVWTPEGSEGSPVLVRARLAADADWAREPMYLAVMVDLPPEWPADFNGFPVRVASPELALSVDGEFLAYVQEDSPRPASGYRPTYLWVCTTEGRIMVEADAGAPPANQLTMGEWAWDHGPAWSPDGGAIAFFRQSEGEETQDLCTVPAAGGQPRIVLQGLRPVWETSVAWSPDGSELLFASGHEPGATAGLYIVTLGDGHVRRITDGGELVVGESDWR